MNVVNPFFSGIPTCHSAGGMAWHCKTGDLKIRPWTPRAEVKAILLKRRSARLEPLAGATVSGRTPDTEGRSGSDRTVRRGKAEARRHHPVPRNAKRPVRDVVHPMGMFDYISGNSHHNLCKGGSRLTRAGP